MHVAHSCGFQEDLKVICPECGEEVNANTIDGALLALALACKKNHDAVAYLENELGSPDAANKINTKLVNFADQISRLKTEIETLKAKVNNGSP